MFGYTFAFYVHGRISKQFVYLPFCPISASQGKAIERVPLPPPLYGSASFSTPKPSGYSSFRPSARSSDRHDAYLGSSQSTSSSGNQVISLKT